MEKFVKKMKEYPTYVCEKCGDTEASVITIKSPQGEILLCVKCLAVERIVAEPQAQPQAQK